MQPILDLIAGRQSAATAAADTLREQIARLTEELHQVEAELADLATTHATVTRLTSHNTSVSASPHDATIYQQIIAAFDPAQGPLRAKDICRTLGTGTEPKDTEGVRAKVKRLVKRQVLTETEPGLFALAAPTQPADQSVTSGPNPEPNPIQT